MRPCPVPGLPVLHTYADHGGLEGTNGRDDDCNGRMRRPNCRQLMTTRRAERKPDPDLRQSKQAMNRKRVYEIIDDGLYPPHVALLANFTAPKTQHVLYYAFYRKLVFLFFAKLFRRNLLNY